MIQSMEINFRVDEAFKLADLCKEYDELGRDIIPGCEFDTIYRDYLPVAEALYQEECDNMGLSKEARELRKEWRRLVRKMTKLMRAYIKNAKDYDREWSKPRTEYIFVETGELHNGLYYTIKAWLDMRKYTKMPLKPMKLSTYNRRYHK